MHPDVQEKVNQLVEKLKEEYQEDLVSVCVYGSAVFRNQPVPVRSKFQNINVLVILNRLDMELLERATTLCRWWTKVGHTVPVFLSREEWNRSQDVFALEYADIRDNHFVAYGLDLYSGISVDYDALRLVLELELHRKLVFLREKYIQLAPRQIQELLQDGVTSFAAIFRGILRMSRREEIPPMAAWDVFEKLATLHISGYDPKPFLKVLEIKDSGYSPRDDETLELCEQFIQQLSLMTDYVDQCYGFIEKKEQVRV